MYRSLKLILWLFVISLSPVSADSELELFYAQYKDDANLSVNSPAISLLHWLNDLFSIKLRYNYEVFEKTSNNTDMSKPDAISGATTVVGGTGSGFKETRKESSLIINYQQNNSSAHIGAVTSNEAHFESITLLGGLGREFFNKNFSINANYALTSDKVLINDPQTGIDNESKTTHSLILSASQLLSPKQTLSFGTGVAIIDGYQSGPLRKISVDKKLNGTNISYPYNERHPDYRERYLGYGQYKQFLFTGTAISLNGSLYKDDWGVKAISFEPVLTQKLNENFRIRIRHRIYQQSSADFYKTSYDQEEDIMTADNRLRSFRSQITGFKVTHSSDRFSGKQLITSIGYNHYRENNNGLTADIINISTRYTF